MSQKRYPEYAKRIRQFIHWLADKPKKKAWSWISPGLRLLRVTQFTFEVTRFSRQPRREPLLFCKVRIQSAILLPLSWKYYVENQEMSGCAI